MVEAVGVGVIRDDMFVAAVEAIYAAAPEPSRWPNALQKIADFFTDVGAVLIWQRDDGSFGTVASPDLVAANQDYLDNGWSSRDLPALRAVERGLWLRTDAASDRHAVSDEEIATHPFYTEFLARHGLRWRAAIGVAPDRHISVALSIQRAATKLPFSDQELEQATRLGRHVENALRLSIRLFNAELLTAGLSDALNRINIGVFALDSLGRIVFSNDKANKLLGDGIRLADDRLLIDRLSERKALEAAIAKMTSANASDLHDAPRPILIQRGSSNGPMAIYVLPIAITEDIATQFLTHVRVIVLAINPEANAPADPALVRDILGLTLGEARVAAIVASGLPPRKAATALGLSEETVRTVLKRVFFKTGVTRQVELTHLLSRLLLQ